MFILFEFFYFIFLDGGKEALSKWPEIKQKNKKASESENSVENGGEKRGKNRRTDSNNNNKASANRRNINDLVASLINECTAQKPASDLNSSVSMNTSLLENFNNIVQPSLLTKAIGGLKVTVLGVEPMNGKAASPVSSSPSSLSVTSAHSAASSEAKPSTDRPNLLEINQKNDLLLKQQPPQQQQQGTLPQPPVKHFNKNINNPNSKILLEKSQKDLQRQTVVLSKISNTFNEELVKSKYQFEQSFNRLRQLLNERQNQLQAHFAQVSQNATQLIAQRQSKAAELKIMSDNAVHLNDNEALELKADIKHFVSERNLDEEFSKMKLFHEENFEKLCEAINSFGSVSQFKNQYATQRPPLNELVNSLASPTTPTVPSTVVPSETTAKLANGNAQVNGGKKKTKVVNENGNGKHPEDDDEGEFIEVKKPRKFIFYFH